jgi:ABC-type multidrug transport system fused ATPase/permease subunit
MIMIKSVLISYGGMSSAMKIHKILLKRVLYSPVSFFDQTLTGRIVNIFSKDQHVVDNDLSSTLFQFFTTLIVKLIFFNYIILF